ncbi:MAG: BACON domain-containing protein, partial [Bacteroidales bacterium]|nr:BACON domain-containing protein [Bacteroidales bacterium]
MFREKLFYRIIFSFLVVFVVLRGCSDSLNHQLNINKTNFEVSHLGDTIEVLLKTTGIYEVSPDVSWIKQQGGSRSLTNKTESFIIASNPTASKIEGSIIFKLNEITERVIIKQDANSNISMN